MFWKLRKAMNGVGNGIRGKKITDRTFACFGEALIGLDLVEEASLLWSLDILASSE